MPRLTLILCFLIANCIHHSFAADPTPAPQQENEDAGDNEDTAEETPVFELKKEVKESLIPLFNAISKAKVSRSTIQLSIDSIVDGIVKNTKKSTYQIASKNPSKFTVYLKEPEQRTRVYCDGKDVSIALAPDAFMKNPKPITTKQAVTDLPIALGPYPEAALALTLAGADPVATFLGAMKSVELVDRGKFRGKTDAIHFRGIQGDDVVWDFWISQGKDPKPLRLMVDLTPMLIASNQMKAPRGFTYLLRFDFLSWRISGTVEESLFDYKPPRGARKYDSVDAYYDAVSESAEAYPLLGKKAPSFSAALPDGKKIETKNLTDRVLVLDFWATWCDPCVKSIPIIQEVTNKYKDKGVIFFPINVGEDADRVKAFLKKQGWDLSVVLDPKTTISSGFAAEAIPLTVVVGKDGMVESAHVGFGSEKSLRERLTEELDILTIGGRIATSVAEEN